MTHVRATTQSTWWLAALIAAFLAPAAATAGEAAVDPSQLTLERIFQDREFAIERYGPARWLADGSGYTTLEASPDFEKQ